MALTKKQTQVLFYSLLAVIISASAIMLIALYRYYVLDANVGRINFVLTVFVAELIACFGIGWKAIFSKDKAQLGSGEVADSSHTDASVKTLKNIGEIAKEVRELFKLDSVSEALTQTFIQTNTVPPSIDQAKQLLKIDIDNRPLLRRIIQLTDPKDIYFVHSNIEFSREYGPGFEIVLLQAHDTISTADNSLVNAFPNFTINGDVTLISFPIKRNNILREPNESAASKGAVINDPIFTKQINEYLDYICRTLAISNDPSCSLSSIKEKLWDNDKRSYLMAIAKSICREVFEEFHEKIIFIGVVGSVIDSRKNENPRDLDIVLSFDVVDKELYEKVNNTVSNVLEAYKLDALIFEAIYVASPVKPRVTDESIFPIQILINTKETMRLVETDTI